MKSITRILLAVIVVAAFNPMFAQAAPPDTTGGTNTQNTNTTNTVEVNAASMLNLPPATRTPQYANGLMVNSSAPTLFQQSGLPASADGLGITKYFYSLVPDVYVKDNETIYKSVNGTKYVFTPVGVNYTKNTDSVGQRTEDIRTLDITSLEVVAPNKTFLYPIGLIQCEVTAKKANEVSPASMLAGINPFVARNLKGHSNYRVIYHPAQFGANIGVVASGKGFGVSPGASGFMSNTLTGMLAGFGTNNGLSHTEAMVHLTAMVFVEVKGTPDPKWPVVDLSVLQPKPTPPPVTAKPEKAAVKKYDERRNLVIQIEIQNQASQK